MLLFDNNSTINRKHEYEGLSGAVTAYVPREAGSALAASIEASWRKLTGGSGRKMDEQIKFSLFPSGLLLKATAAYQGFLEQENGAACKTWGYHGLLWLPASRGHVPCGLLVPVWSMLKATVQI